MNTAQRRLVLAALAALALGLHFWNLRWDYKTYQPDLPLADMAALVTRDNGGVVPPWWVEPFATFQWATEPRIHSVYENWDAESEEMTRRNGSVPHVARWGGQMWKRYENDGRPMPWMDYLRSRSHATVYLGLWRAGSEDDAWLWGVFAPLGVIGVAVFLVLGWRKPKGVTGSDGEVAT